MDDYAGRVLADRYRLPLPPSDVFELVETRAFDTYSGQEVIVRQVPLPEVVEAEVVGFEGVAGAADVTGMTGVTGGSAAGARVPAGAPGRGGQGSADPAVHRALVAATAAARIPDHPRLDQVFHVFAEAGSLWIVSELVSARPLAALLAERTLSPHRAAEVAADVLTALRALHAHGWTHRNITTRTVLICDDGRAILTGLAAGAAEEALCGYDPVPEGTSPGAGAGAGAGMQEPAPGTRAPGTQGSGGPGSGGSGSAPGARTAAGPGAGGAGRPSGAGFPGQRGAGAPAQSGAGRPASGAVPPGTGASQGSPGRQDPGQAPPGGPGGSPSGPGGAPRGASGAPAYRDQGAAGGFPPAPGAPSGSRSPRAGADGRDGTQDPRAARAGAIAAYRAGARAAARATVEGGSATSTGASTWGGGSAASGTAPAPSPWTMPPPSRAPRPPSSQKGSNPRKPPRPGAPAGPGATPAPPSGTTPPSSPLYTGHVSVDVPPPAAPSGANARAGQAGSSSPSGASGPSGPSARWDGDGRPASGLAAERARQARMAVVGAVTERWAPEQAWPVRESWQLAPPVGPAADLWALGALLFRVVQGHAPYPEESVAELVQVVCAEPPAYAEECGALRPVVESLMRKDPAERPEFEELRGWLRSLIRSAPEPEIGSRTVTVPSIGPSAPADQHRLPIVRRKGELVRRRRPRAAAPADSAGTASAHAHGRHKRSAKDQVQPRVRAHTTGHLQEQHVRTRRGPRSLGRLMLGLILLLLIGAVLYALLFMPGADGDTGDEATERTGVAGVMSAAPSAPATAGRAGRPSPAGPAEAPAAEGGEVAKGFTLRQDPKGFTLAVAKDWQRRGENDRGQVVYAGGDIQLIVVPGRDKTAEFGTDPMAYQQNKEPELEAYRTSSWSGASGLRRIDVGRTASAEGSFNWNDSSGRQVYVRNSAMLLEGAYHVLQVIGPMNEQRTVDGYFDQATATYRVR
ncbi:protein kinase [Streptomyces albireticuli]|uniref:protein kinase n=2 Tax=Streptomyces albireticuli TaxID=1940 RepID=UPI001E36679E|nr:protein kinase [Streptomyces albireticuli]MCD9144651.1 protein kinase [Streptomyces albireticuli]MCD9165399.1 protein kinase [Streptomyces albireticuli]MCD9193558.1 protein kinase [Streptomyces albireticuli]